MADNVLLPATGTGTASVTQATDDVSGVHYPLVKLVNSTADATTRTGIAADPLIVKSAANSAVDIGDVDVTSIVPGVAATNLGKAEDTTHTTGDTGVMILGVRNVTHQTLAGTDLDYTPINVDAEGCVVVVGNIPHDTGDADPPIKVGTKAISNIAAATMVAAADRANMVGDLDGMLLVRPHTTIGNVLVERVSDATGNSTASTVFGATANAKNCITTIAVYNASTTSSGYVDIRDGTGGTILFTLPCPAGGGAVVHFPVPLVQSTSNTALAYDVSAAITTVYISFIGFKSKSF